MSRPAMTTSIRGIEVTNPDPKDQLALVLLPLVLTQSRTLAIGGSLLNAWDGVLPSYYADQLRCFLPEALPPVRIALLGSGLERHQIVSGVEDFSAHLDFARRLVLSSLEMGAAEYASRTEALGVLKDFWRGLAVAGQLLIVQLTSLSRRPQDVTQDFAVNTTLNLLNEVGAGRSPCLDEAGGINFEHLFNRRRAPRLHVDMAVDVVSESGRQACAISDVSASGVGLRSVSGLKHGEVVRLILSPGRELSGAVAWAVDDRAGIRLNGEEAATDPLIAWAASWHQDL